MLVLLASNAGCASIGPATPALSAEVGQRIADMQGVHELAVRRYFDAERRRVQDFLDEKWTPLFLRNFVGTSNIVQLVVAAPRLEESRKAQLADAVKLYVSDPALSKQASDAVIRVVEAERAQEPAQLRAALGGAIKDERVATAAATHLASLLGTEEPGVLLIEWAQDAEAEIRQKREELLTPLDTAERAVLAELSSAYADILSAQAVITSRLEAAASVKKEQDRALKELGVDATFDKVKKQLTNVSQAVGKALAKASSGDANTIAERLGVNLQEELDQALEVGPAPKP